MFIDLRKFRLCDFKILIVRHNNIQRDTNIHAYVSFTLYGMGKTKYNYQLCSNDMTIKLLISLLAQL